MAKNYQAGDLDRKGTLYRYDTHKDAVGGVSNSLTAIKTGIWCKKEHGSGRESQKEGLVVALGQVDFVLRYNPDIKETMVFECEGIKYDILEVSEGPGRRQWTILKTQKRDVNAG